MEQRYGENSSEWVLSEWHETLEEVGPKLLDNEWMDLNSW